MKDLSPPARRYILQIMILGGLVAIWELSHLPEKSLGLFLMLLLHVIGAHIFKDQNPSDHTKRIASHILFAGGMVFVIWQLPQLPDQNVWVFLAMGSLAAVAHILKQPGPTSRSSYQASFIIYGFSMILLGAPATILIIIIAHMLEYAWGTYYPWYIQCFNIATLIISTSVACNVVCSTNVGVLNMNFTSLLGIVAAIAIFVLLNHFLVGLVLKTARNQSFKESGVFAFLTLMIDFSLLCMGAVSALLWQLNPYAVFLGAIPLHLVYNSLRTPSLERKSETDTKTGVYNSGYFAKSLQSELARAHRFGRPLTLVMGDLDFLREINNTHGHLAGDAVLQGIARRLCELSRDYDIVARFGGEEFAILMPETTPEAAKPMIESMRQAIANTEYKVSTKKTSIKATMSFGIAGRERAEQSADELIHNADLALYEAKKNGRDRVVVFRTEKKFEIVQKQIALEKMQFKENPLIL